jgi:uncharacterized protein (TIGR03118 family)
VKHKIDLYFASLFLFGFLFAADKATAQTISYRQTNLASNIQGKANNVTLSLANPWGIAFLSGQSFFIADNKAGRVTSHDATGANVAPGSFIVPNIAGTGFDNPTGIVADQNSSFGGPSLIKPFILVTEQGSIFTWGPNAQGDLPQQATLVRRRASGVFKGVVILDSLLTQPVLAVTDFHEGFIDTFLPGFSQVALPGSFTDPTLPAGYAPFGIQVIGRQVFVTYALQDAAKHDPVVGKGNGIVSIFDMDGNFVRRFATGGALNAPWGITRASANFGPFSNDILIGNVGDGTINAFDPATGDFAGELIDGDGNGITEVGLHALAFRADRFGDTNTLYFTSELTNEQDGLFGAITTGLVSTTRGSAPDSPANTSVRITATVAAGPGNAGAPTGMVTFLDGANRLGTAPLVNGSAAVDAILTQAGIHNITALYSGDVIFLASTDRISLQVTANADFSLGAAPPATIVVAGQSTQFMLTVTPAGGFADNVTFSCAPITGITCAFNPVMVTPANGDARTTLTVTTSATVPRYGLLMAGLIGPGALLVVLALFSLVIRRGGKLRTARASLQAATAAATIVALGLAMGGCGGYGSSTQPNRGTASILVTAHSGAVSHTATVMVTVQ